GRLLVSGRARARRFLACLLALDARSGRHGAGAAARLRQLAREQAGAGAGAPGLAGAGGPFSTSDSGVNAVVAQAVDDLAGLRMHRYDEAAARGTGDRSRWIAAAGVPWFVALFGRDSLIVSLQTLALSPHLALGALGALGAAQADAYDDERDMQPGKILHALRQVELASLHLIPHTPYYGTHDATTLYVLTAARAWRWRGDLEGLEAVRPHVERA